MRVEVLSIALNNVKVSSDTIEVIDKYNSSDDDNRGKLRLGTATATSLLLNNYNINKRRLEVEGELSYKAFVVREENSRLSLNDRLNNRVSSFLANESFINLKNLNITKFLDRN